jgi:hypothetical protein
MAEHSEPSTTNVETSDTVRIDRRNTILAQIEAALLADKLSLEEVSQQVTGTDPYNSGGRRVTETGVWNGRSKR